jgi:hypothetical protein
MVDFASDGLILQGQTSPVVGGAGETKIVYDTGAGSLMASVAGAPYGALGGAGSLLVFCQTGAPVTVTNTITPTTLLTMGTGSLTVPANTLDVGRCLRFSARGIISTASSQPFYLDVKLNGTALGLGTGATTPVAAVSNGGWRFDYLIPCITTGAGGTVRIYGDFMSAPSLQLFGDANVGGTNVVNTTIAQTLDLLVEWSVALPTNSITCHIATLELL